MLRIVPIQTTASLDMFSVTRMLALIRLDTHTGGIPQQLPQSTDLELLNISGNQINGKHEVMGTCGRPRDVAGTGGSWQCSRNYPDPLGP